METSKIIELEHELLRKEGIEAEIRERYVPEQIICRGLQAHEGEILSEYYKISDPPLVSAGKANSHNAMAAIEKFSGNHNKAKAHLAKSKFYTGMCYLETGVLCLAAVGLACYLLVGGFGSYPKKRINSHTSEFL